MIYLTKIKDINKESIIRYDKKRIIIIIFTYIAQKYIVSRRFTLLIKVKKMI